MAVFSDVYGMICFMGNTGQVFLGLNSECGWIVALGNSLSKVLSKSLVALNCFRVKSSMFSPARHTPMLSVL